LNFSYFLVFELSEMTVLKREFLGIFSLRGFFGMKCGGC
jgi:hypothetical protein